MVMAEVMKIDFGQKAGDRFEFTSTLNPDICAYTLAPLLPAVQVLLHVVPFPQGSFTDDWLEEGEPLLWGYPHPVEGQVIFELKKVQGS